MISNILHQTQMTGKATRTTSSIEIFKKIIPKNINLANRKKGKPSYISNPIKKNMQRIPEITSGKTYTNRRKIQREGLLGKYGKKNRKSMYKVLKLGNLETIAGIKHVQITNIF